jgi:hypothetical protein
MSKAKTIFMFILISLPCFAVPVLSLFQGGEGFIVEIARIMLRMG